MLLEPQLEQPRGGSRLKARDRHQTADILGGDRPPMDLVAVGKEAQTLPQADLLHVGIRVEFKHTVISSTVLNANAAPVVERFGVVETTDGDAVFRKSASYAARIERHDSFVRNVGRTVRDIGRGEIASGVCRSWRDNHHYGCKGKRSCAIVRLLKPGGIVKMAVSIGHTSLRSRLTAITCQSFRIAPKGTSDNARTVPLEASALARSKAGLLARGSSRHLPDLPGCPVVHIGSGLATHSCGGSHGFGASNAPTVFPLSPLES